MKDFDTVIHGERQVLQIGRLYEDRGTRCFAVFPFLSGCTLHLLMLSHVVRMHFLGGTGLGKREQSGSHAECIPKKSSTITHNLLPVNQKYRYPFLGRIDEAPPHGDNWIKLENRFKEERLNAESRQ